MVPSLTYYSGTVSTLPCLGSKITFSRHIGGIVKSLQSVEFENIVEIIGTDVGGSFDGIDLCFPTHRDLCVVNEYPDSTWMMIYLPF